MYRSNEKLILRLKKEKREELIKQLKNVVTPDDVVASIFSFLTVDEIPLDVKRIHSAFYQIKQEWPNMFNQFVFSRKGYYRYSNLLERVLFRLQNADLINTINPDFKRCIVSKESKQHIRKNILPLFGEEEKKKLAKMGQVFENLVLSTR